MSESTFRDLTQQLTELYDKKQEYAQAFALLQSEYKRFPNHAHKTYYWRIFMAARLGKQSLALQIFEEALQRGYWFAPEQLEKDEDLISLRSLPAFQQMVEICRQHLHQAQDSCQPELLVAQPAKQAIAIPLLLALHGNWSNARDFCEELQEITARGWLLAVSQSSQIIGQDTYIWNDRERGIKEIREHIVRLNKEYNIDPKRIVLGGYSMGGGLAIWMALYQSIQTRGFIVFAPFLSELELEAFSFLLDTQKPIGLRGSITVGEKDPLCLEPSRKVAEIMHAHNLPCYLEICPNMDHDYPYDFLARVEKGLLFIEQG